MSAENHPTRPPAAPASDFWKRKTVEELAAEQGVKPWTPGTFAQMQALASEVWPEDDVEEFLAWLRETRGHPPLPRPTVVP